jgi:DTW domain-containing protein YfiP
MGYDFSNNEELNAILAEPTHHPVVLYPGPASVDLTKLKANARPTIFPRNKIPLIIVIDGTWSTARKMLRRSRNLNRLPRICFTPDRPSQFQFQVRQQPKPQCLSTIEAIHQVIELLNPSTPEHDNLIFVFQKMVEQQLEFIRQSHARNRGSRHRRRRQIQQILEASQILE